MPARAKHRPSTSRAHGDSVQGPSSYLSDVRLRQTGVDEGVGYYVFGIIDTTPMDVPVEVFPERGMSEGYAVYGITVGNAQAVVSRVPLEEFGAQALQDNMEDMAWLEQHVCQHEAVLEHMMAQGTIVPMRFGTLYSSETGVHTMLATHQDAFLALLKRLKDRREWGVKVYADMPTLRAQVCQNHPRILALTAEINTQTAGLAHFLKKRREKLVLEEVEAHIRAWVSSCHEALRIHAEAHAWSPVQEARSSHTQRLAMNVAYLVPRAHESAFKEVLAACQAKVEKEFHLDLTGPWPPYSFVNLEPAPSHG